MRLVANCLYATRNATLYMPACLYPCLRLCVGMSLHGSGLVDVSACIFILLRFDADFWVCTRSWVQSQTSTETLPSGGGQTQRWATCKCGKHMQSGRARAKQARLKCKPIERARTSKPTHSPKLRHLKCFAQGLYLGRHGSRREPTFGRAPVHDPAHPRV